MDDTLPGLLLLLILLSLSALFSALETALFSLRPGQAAALERAEPVFGAKLARWLAKPRRLLSSLLILDACANVPLILLALYHFHKAGPPWSEVWLELLLLFPVIVFLGDLLPKLAAWMNPLRVVRRGLGLADPFLRAVVPAVRLLQTACDAAAGRLLPASVRPQLHLDEEELETLVQLSAEEGVLHPSESEIIQEIMKLRGKSVRDCMTPRVDVVSIGDDLTNDEVLAELRQNRRRRLPIYGETPDEILGILEARTFLDERGRPYAEVMVPPSFVPETMPALDLLRNFLQHPQGMAVIVDEFGGTEGVITLADLIEEILGDALPSGEHELYIETLSPGELLVSGHARLDDLQEYINLEASAEGVDTINGLIFHELGYLPKKGARFRLGGNEVTVRRVTRKRVEEVVIRGAEPEEETGA